VSQLETLAQNTDDALMLSDHQARPVYFNPAYAHAMKELLGLHMKPGVQPHKLLPPEQAAVWDEYHRRVLAGESFVAEFEFTDPQGVTRHFETSFMPISAGDRITGFSEITRDISKRKHAEQRRLALEAQLMHTQKLESLGVMAGGIAHDFNNLLMSILGNTDLALAKLTPNSPARVNLTQISESAQRAGELAAQMLAYSGGGNLATELVDLTAVIGGTRELLRATTSKKATIHHHLSPSLPPIEADASQIRQVLINLVTNAAESLGSGEGAIEISTGVTVCDEQHLRSTLVGHELPSGEYVRLGVRDTGCGMDEETLTKIFDPFFTTKFTGRGLGMSATLGIIRSHRGTISVTSRPGEGTDVVVLLPCAQAGSSSISSPATSVSSDSPRTILVVDDEDAVLAVVAEMLELLGYRVLTASDGKQALDICRTQGSDISLVLLDMTMPLMDGEEALSELHRLDPTLKVILSSGFSQEEANRRFAEKNLAGFIQKPYRAAKLQRLLVRILET